MPEDIDDENKEIIITNYHQVYIKEHIMMKCKRCPHTGYDKFNQNCYDTGEGGACSNDEVTRAAYDFHGGDTWYPNWFSNNAPIKTFD